MMSTTCTVIEERSRYETYFQLSLVCLINVHRGIWDVSTPCYVGYVWQNISIYLKVNWENLTRFFSSRRFDANIVSYKYKTGRPVVVHT